MVGQADTVWWQKKIARQVYLKRMFKADPKSCFVVSMAIKFYAKKRGAFDVENYTKHAIDGIALGLMENDRAEIDNRIIFNGKDCNFRYIFYERLEDVDSFGDEGIGIVVCCR